MEIRVRLDDTVLLWLPLLAVTAHLCEEFVWPGGFADWYRLSHPERAASITTRFLVTVNVILLGLALLPVILGPTPRGLAWWLVVVALGAANAVFHVRATARHRAYSPGVVTSVLLYLPLAVVGVRWLVLPGRVAVATALQALIIGVGYHVWSAWTHRRRSALARPAA